MKNETTIKAEELREGDLVIQYLDMTEPKRWDKNPLRVIGVHLDRSYREELIERCNARKARGLSTGPLGPNEGITYEATTQGSRGGERTQYLDPESEVIVRTPRP